MGVSVTQRRPHLPDSVLHMLHRVLKRAGLPKVRFHDLRHTFATLALQNGVDIKTVSGMLGHYSAGFTLDTYAHVTTAAQKEAARAMGKVLANALWKYPKTKRGPGAADMYPLYWTPSRGGIIMRYTYEYKRKCVELYREGKWPETPEGVSDKSFRDKVRLWVRAEDSRGPEALKHKNFNRNWTPEERLELVSQVMSGKSCVSVAIEAGIQDRLLYQWVQNYKTKGYNGLVEMKKGRPSKGVPQMKKEEARPLNESEREELIRLRAENEYIKAENEVIKKEIALREERHAAQLKARKQRSSKSCVKKDTN